MVFNVRKISILVTILITSFVMALAGLVASPIATASENDGSISATFPLGSSVLTKDQKAAIKKAFASSGSDVRFIVTGTAGKLPGVSDRWVQRLAKKRAQAIKAYLVSLGVSKTSITTQSSTTEIGVGPKSTGSYPTSAPTPTPTVTATSTTPPTATTISVAAIAGVTAPVTGATPVTTTTAGTGYTGTVTWSGSPTTFAAVIYTATITLTPSSGYTLVGVTANFFTVAGATSDTNSADSGVITAVFPVAPTTISVAAIAGVTAPVTGDTRVTTTTAGIGYTGTVTWSPSAGTTFASATTYTATITLTPSSGYTLAGVTANFFTVAGATSDTNSANAGVITAVFPVTATTYAVGDRGPGGGIVFYVSAANFTSTGSDCSSACKYLEVAPATWQDTTAPIYTTVENDIIYAWSNDTTVFTLQNVATASTEGIVANSANEKLNWKIGQGFNNTRIMKVTGATSAAQAAVLAYAGNSTAGQWFIPSMNELNELCKYARGQTTGVLTVRCDYTGTLKTGTANDLGGFVGSWYWSSSESIYASNAWSFIFTDGNAYNDNKGAVTTYVRPVRAF